MTEQRKKHHPIRRNREEEPELPLEPRRERRALSHVGGEVTFVGGSEQEHAVLTSALDVSSDEDEVMSDIHGFHSYPARLHPLTARRLIEGFSAPGARVLDPFCGSGTVVVEARALGRHALGSDLNPLAVELSWLKSRGPTKKHLDDMVNAAAQIAEVAEERRMRKADPHRLYEDEDRERYPIHILLELDSLAHGIDLIGGTEVKRMLRLVISSLLTKLSHSEGDTTRRATPRRLPGGFAVRLFSEKAQELAERLDAYRERLPDKAPRAHVGNADARALEHIESDSVDLIVTSPPYPGVYDYLDHHLHRIRWLGLRAARLSEGEIGARRHYRRLRLDEAIAQWKSELAPTLYELRRTLADDGRGILVIADSVADRSAVYADDLIREIAERAGVDITCIASQPRPLFLHGAERAFNQRPRMEHVVVFRPARQRKPGPRRKDDGQGPQKAPWSPPRSDARGPRTFQRDDSRGERPPRRDDARGPRSFQRDDARGERPPRRDDARGPRSFQRDDARGERPPRRDDARGPRSFQRDDRPPRRDDARGPRSFARDDARGARPPRRDGVQSARPRSRDDERSARPPRRDGEQSVRPRPRDDEQNARSPRSNERGRDERRERPGSAQRPGSPQRPNQDKTWRSKPRGPERPRSKSDRKPK